MSNTTANASSPVSLHASPAWVGIVQQQVHGLRFGVVQIVVHDGRVVQIERTERTRLPGQSPNIEAMPG